MSDILSLAKLIGGKGFVDMCNQDVNELFANEEIQDYELFEIAMEPSKNNDYDDVLQANNNNNNISEFTLSTLKEGFKLARKLEDFFVSADPIFERSLNFKRNLKHSLYPYQTVYINLLKNQVKQK